MVDDWSCDHRYLEDTQVYEPWYIFYALYTVLNSDCIDSRMDEGLYVRIDASFFLCHTTLTYSDYDSISVITVV